MQKNKLYNITIHGYMECIEIVKIVLEKNQIYFVNYCYKKIVTTGYNTKRVFKRHVKCDKIIPNFWRSLINMY